jgi:prepilin-type N-terminal cleavage/methylation domain-containing protein
MKSLSYKPFKTSIKQSGFTLLEVMMSIFIFTMLAMGAYSLITSFFSASTKQNKSLGTDDQARKVTSSFVNELRNANWGNDGSYPVNQAGTNQFIFYSTSATNNSIINRIRYYTSGNSLYKGVVTPSGAPLVYNIGSEVVTKIQDNLGNGANPIFSYYKDTYDGTGTALAQPINLTQVNFVKISLTLLSTAGNQNTATYTITAGASIRNLKTNLGN